MNKLATVVIRRTGGRMGGQNALLLTTIGRKTGQERTTPVGWFPGENDTWLIVASAAGAAANPAWYYNLVAAPDRVRIELAGRLIDVRAEQLLGAERAKAWQAICASAPRFAQYETKTDREIPVIRLSRR
jgi:deazaflavin-dependent oxidoreductase (nitroreductase family)